MRKPTKKRVGKSSGFTLVELVFTMLIIGILVSTFTFAMKWARDRAMFAKFMSDVRLIKIAAQRFEQDVGVFPPDVWRNVDPGMVSKYGWQSGGHSAKWEGLNLSGWKGPYLENWPISPWGGMYDWDNYEPGYDYMGIKGGAVYVTLKPSAWGGLGGMPNPEYEKELEREGIDTSNWPQCIAVRMGTYPSWNELGGDH